jgi:hypothetical protein
MANSPGSGARIYDRPERKTVSPLILVLVLLALLVAGYFAYRAWGPGAAGAPQNPPGMIIAGTAFLSGSRLNESLQ